MANSIIGALRVIVGLDSAELYEGVDKTKEKLSELSLGAKASIAAAAAAFTGLIFNIKGINDEILKVDKLSRDFELPSEELSKMSFAAKVLGGDVKDIVSAFKNVKAQIEGFDAESDFAKGLKLLSINVKDAEGNFRSTREVLDEVMNKLAGYRDGANKSALATAILGGSGEAMLKMFEEGTGKFQTLMQEAEKLGLVFGNKLAPEINFLNETLAKLNLAKDAFSFGLSKTLLPGINSVIDAFYELAKSGREWSGVSALIETGLKIIGAGLILAAGLFKGFLEVVNNAATAMKEFFSGNWAAAAAAAGRSLTDPLNTLADSMAIIKKFGEGAEITNATNRVGAFADAFSKMRGAMRGDAPAMPKAGGEDPMKNYDSGLIRRIELLKAERETIGLGTAERIRANEIIQLEHALRKAGVKDFEGEKAKRMEQIELLYQEARATEATKKAWADFQAGLDVFRNAWSSAIDKLIDGTFKFKDAIKDLGKSLLKLALNNMFTAFFGKGNQPGFLNLGQMFGFGGGKALGGNVGAGKMYMVGENGPEYFVPRVPGEVVPQNKLGGPAGSVGVGSVTINAPGADPAQLQRVIAALAQLDATLEKRAAASEHKRQVRKTRA